ncbi:PAS domain S-box protein [Fulvivirgaceae bacterium PWU4]|uniref:PAS domain S-box protein n=1 Tax=Chryseosolibacter histidini TaxID=2782349 RepID=A0AAP2GJ06_9BACT|nr:PAS domain S-box protein [Chryseosolibacter histidini]MBT1697539.1 PAS domain S-box protein [Chryseosolibacter histidini]
MRSRLVAFIVFIAVAALTQYVAYQRHLITLDNERAKVTREINTVKERLKTALSYSLSATQTLAFLVKEYGVPEDFDSVGKEIIGSNRNIDVLELTKGGVITHVYPRKGNEAALGYDILKDSLRNEEAYKALEKNALFFAGPFELKQGGMAVVGRLPIFRDRKFFGFSAVIIKLSTLLEAAGLKNTQDGDFHYQLSKINPATKKEEYFLASPLPVADKWNAASIEVPDGQWKLYVVARENGNIHFATASLSVLGLVLAITSGLFVLHLARQPEKLERLVEIKTHALAASEKYFRSLIEKSSDAIVLLDSAGKVIYQSHSTEQIIGYTLEESQAFNGADLIHPDDREADIAMFASLVQSPGAVVARTHRFKHKNGNYIWIEGTYSNLLNDDNVKAIVYNYHDITRRVEFEQKVDNVRKEKETALNRINDSVVSVDNAWRYTFLNDAALATHPLGRDTLGKTMLEAHPDLAGSSFWEKYQEAMRTRQTQELEDYYPPMQRWFMVKVYPSGSGLTIYYKDITDRKKAEQDVIMERNFSVSIINSLPGIFYMYDHEGKFIRWNNNFEIVSGYSAEEIRGMHPLDFFDRDEKRIVGDKIKTVFIDGDSDVTAHFFTKNKTRIPYYFNGRRVHFNGITYLIGMGIDITDRVKAERELYQRTEEIQELTAHLERIREEERTRMAREIHDELGQQLTGLKMDISWIIRKNKTEDKLVADKLSSMIALVDETMKTVRRISSELRPGILDDLGLIPALEWQTQEFEKRTGIKTLFHAAINDFNPERELSTNIFRVYQEALTNIARHAHASLVTTELEVVNGCVKLVVSDNGQGFDTDGVKKSSLGLVGMKERARMFKGELTINSKRSQGTVVMLKVPWVANPQKIAQ